MARPTLPHKKSHVCETKVRQKPANYAFLLAVAERKDIPTAVEARSLLEEMIREKIQSDPLYAGIAKELDFSGVN